MRRSSWLLLISLMFVIVGASLAHAGTLGAAVLTIEAPSQSAQGETATVIVTLVDATNKPLAGETVTVYAATRVLGTTGRLKVGEARMDFSGQAKLTFSPTVAGKSELIAAYAGSDLHAGTAVSTPFTVAVGALPGYTLSQQAPVPAVSIPWFLIPLLGVWVAYGMAIYHIARIPNEVGQGTQGLHLPSVAATSSD